MRNRYLNFILIGICLLLIINLIRTWWQLQGRGDVVKKAEERLDQALDLQKKLERDLARVKNPKFIEQQARNKLNLTKEGDVVLIMPQITPEMEPTQIPVDTSSNLEKWLKVFL
ncbi:hypothetical protein A2960_05365 [Candidatus Gottesmanbacteria bacterium RIFCSPLOWO2_01_FULL_39_12b]|uniref:Septum formation initiator n=1 Tax=Candidatus Gottesmanbacteria bacterium RIFCSPLOWO2_01_FULL_39_12b TaxID=1798388 RepID=A0A1F6ANA7_9BACT|nr:MAG: hypothetical protein A2960_05365 [Candidatus Gottesmanbacteria bacterium RIFCSPLOWO2_01_FULL_39_12b]